MSTIPPSQSAFPFANQEYALVGDTRDPRYHSFNIAEPGSFVDDALREHLNPEVAQQQQGSGVIQYQGPIPIIDPLSTAMQTYRYINHTRTRKLMGNFASTTSSDNSKGHPGVCWQVEQRESPSYLQAGSGGESSLC